MVINCLLNLAQWTCKMVQLLITFITVCCLLVDANSFALARNKKNKLKGVRDDGDKFSLFQWTRTLFKWILVLLASTGVGALVLRQFDPQTPIALTHKLQLQEKRWMVSMLGLWSYLAVCLVSLTVCLISLLIYLLRAQHVSSNTAKIEAKKASVTKQSRTTKRTDQRLYI